MKWTFILPALASAILFSPPTQVQLLDPMKQPQFVNPLPIPSVLDARAGGSFSISMSQFQQHLGLFDPVTKAPLLTKVWGYNHHYPGPTILARKNVPVNVLWENKLLDQNGSVLPHLLTIDPTLHWALMDHPDYKSAGVPLVTHLHGGHTESASDGIPEAWFTPDFVLKGKDFVKATYHYANDQEAATIWYHDHALGITRLNVYAGLAGFYLLTDDNEAALQANRKLPAAPYDLGLAIQDRMFMADGQLYYPTAGPSEGAPENSVMAEFFGNIILVNGMAWPVLEVEPRAYRFRILNGSDSRFYDLFLSSNQPVKQIGSDDGLLPAPVTLQRLLMAPGERRDVVIDFSDPKLAGQTIILKNNAKTPYPKGSAVNPKTTGRIMAFKVTKPLNPAYPDITLPTSLRPAIAPLQTTLAPRKLILYESEDEYGRLKPMLGTFEDGILDWDAPVTEKVRQNNTEIWEVHNFTPDAHPIHLHMVHMQLINRQRIQAAAETESGKPVNVRYIGAPRLPAADEAGWKDTYISYPGEVLRVIANFDLAGLYVWHCHILSHEDHEMMRPFLVLPSTGPTAQSSAIASPDEEAAASLQLQAIPNPFSNELNIRFQLRQPSEVRLSIYTSNGVVVAVRNSGSLQAGANGFSINGSNWSSGVYFCELLVNGKRYMRKLVLEK